MEAYNGCLLAYGQTGAGKSHSVLGDLRSETERGLLPRSVERLFEMVDARVRAAEKTEAPLQVTVLASYLEIYQEKMFDLLGSTRSQELQVRVHPDLGPHVPHLIENPVLNVRDVGELLDFGAKNRAVGATAMNAHSSRSHAVFTIDLRLSSTGMEAKDHHSKIHFVDLAGSEKLKKTHALGAGLQEGIAINQSLSSLSRVIQSLASGQANSGARPPFRESKLTLLLKDALSGNSKTVLVACISPARSNLEESVSTLDFAARCKLVRTTAKRNEQDKRSLIESLSAEKRKVEEQLQAEVERRMHLVAELKREAEQSRISQDLAERMREEKVAVEKRLRALEEEQVQPAAAQMREKLAELRLMEELELRKAAETQAREQQARQRVEEEERMRAELEEELKRELTGLQSLSESWALEKNSLEQRYQAQRRDRDQLLRELGILGLSAPPGAPEPPLEDTIEAPRLINLHPDPMLEGSLVYCIPRGETRIGADQRRCRVWLAGLDVVAEVCVLSNEDGRRLTVRPLPGGLVRVNGVTVADEPKQLCDSDRLAIGRAHIFRVVLPSSTTKREEIEHEEREFDRAMRELFDCAEVDPRWQRSVDAAVLTVKRDIGTREANALLERARRASEAVAEANAVLRTIPASWAGGVSHYELAVLLEAEGSPTICVVARRLADTDGRGGGVLGGAGSAGIWEISRFQEERLPQMHQAAEKLRLRALAGNAPRPGFLSPMPLQDIQPPQIGDWEALVWAEVSPAEIRDLCRVNVRSANGVTQPSRMIGDVAPLAPTAYRREISHSIANDTIATGSRDDSVLAGSDQAVAGGVFSDGSAPAGYASGCSGELVAASSFVPAGEPPAGGAVGRGGYAPKVPGLGIASLASSNAPTAATAGFDAVDTLAKFGGSQAVPETSAAPASTPSAAPGSISIGGRSGLPLNSVVRGASGRSTTPRGRAAPARGSGAITPPRATTPPRTSTPTGATARRSGGTTPRGTASAGALGSGGASATTPRGTNAKRSAGGGSTPRNLTPRGSRTSLAAAAGGTSGGGADVSSASQGPRRRTSERAATQADEPAKIVNVRVDQLFKGRLGVHLRSDRLIVSGLDAPEVVELGWCMQDEILAVNGRPVRTKDEFSASLAEVCEFPIIFTVKRGGPSFDGESSSNSPQQRRGGREPTTPRREVRHSDM
eukprot:TRINITY_DN63944_c0_g1_i1.p1 TRINITY_DN63944_c0_g1~~TRINITY_DN63944_c0_g1_i1.p1  ORF type:complete len:1367 (-),score=222.35 TRINITY_DN63944_c0_g1_i1:296-3826(-)